MGSTPNLPPDGGRTFFDGVETDLAGDVVLGNLEGTLSTGGGSKCGAGSTNCFAFQTPPSYAAWLRKAGFTVLNLANNHAFDFGAAGQAQTLAALDRAGLATPGGPARSPTSRSARSASPSSASRPYPWAQPLTEIPAARRLVQKAAANADVVIVTMHAGAEGTEPHARAAAAPRRTWARTAATRRASRTRSSTPAPISSSATALTCCAAWSGTGAA